MFFARINRLAHIWLVSIVLMAFYAITSNLEKTTKLFKCRALTCYDPSAPFGQRTIDVSCACGRVFWTRAGWMTKRPVDWAERHWSNESRG